MTANELLEEAKRRYPVGTKYGTAFGSYNEYIVGTQNFSIYSKNTIWGEASKGVLYYSGNWAKIITQNPKYMIYGIP